MNSSVENTLHFPLFYQSIEMSFLEMLTETFPCSPMLALFLPFPTLSSSTEVLSNPKMYSSFCLGSLPGDS